MRSITAYGKAEGGKIHVGNMAEFKQAIAVFPDCLIKIKIEQFGGNRSHPQNAYYWGVVIEEFQAGYHDTTGEAISNADTHELLKHECNYKEVINQSTGAILRHGISTANLSTGEFTEYLERCRAFIKEYFNRNVPEPNEQTTEWQG